MTLSHFERERIARQYGAIVRDDVSVQVIERGVSAFDPLNMPSWREARALGMRLVGRARSFQALARRESEAREPAPVERLVMVRQGCKPRKERSRKPRVIIPRVRAREKLQERDMAILAMLQAGKLQPEIAEAIGLDRRAVYNAMGRLRRDGHAWPQIDKRTRAKIGAMLSKKIAKKEAALEEKRMEWLRLVTGGMTHGDAAEQVGFARGTACKISQKLEARGFDVPRNPKAAGSLYRRKEREK